MEVKTGAVAWWKIFFFHDTANAGVYTLSLHDALPISSGPSTASPGPIAGPRARGTLSKTACWPCAGGADGRDRIVFPHSSTLEFSHSHKGWESVGISRFDTNRFLGSRIDYKSNRNLV